MFGRVFFNVFERDNIKDETNIKHKNILLGVDLDSDYCKYIILNNW